MTLQQLNFFANLDYETMRQSLIAGLKIDPEDADALRRRIEGLTKSADEGDEPVPETLRELLGLLKLGITKVPMARSVRPMAAVLMAMRER